MPPVALCNHPTPRAGASAAVALLGALAVGCSPPFESAGPSDAAADGTVPAVDASDARAGGPDDAGAATPLDWAQWPMPNSPIDVEAGAPNPESYVDHGDGTVTDTVTGLMWQAATPDAGVFPQLTWGIWGTGPTAATFCDELSFAGHQDWRLPTLIELVSIVDYTLENPAINALYFPNTTLDVFWSSTPAIVAPGNAWGVSFDLGYTGYGDETLPGRVRCVRGGS